MLFKRSLPIDLVAELGWVIKMKDRHHLISKGFEKTKPGGAEHPGGHSQISNGYSTALVFGKGAAYTQIPPLGAPTLLLEVT